MISLFINFNLTKAEIWATIIGAPIGLFLLVLAIFQIRLYIRNFKMTITPGYTINGNRASMTLRLSLCNSRLVPIILTSMKIKFKNKLGSYFKHNGYKEKRHHPVEPGPVLRISLPLFVNREFKKEKCKAKVIIRTKDVNGKRYKHTEILEHDFSSS